MCPAPAALAAVLASIRAHHSYEEPAIDVYPLHETNVDDSRATGSGRIGRLREPLGLKEFAMSVGRVLGGIPVAMVGEPDRQVEPSVGRAHAALVTTSSKTLRG